MNALKSLIDLNSFLACDLGLNLLVTHDSPQEQEGEEKTTTKLLLGPLSIACGQKLIVDRERLKFSRISENVSKLNL